MLNVKLFRLFLSQQSQIIAEELHLHSCDRLIALQLYIFTVIWTIIGLVMTLDYRQCNHRCISLHGFHSWENLRRKWPRRRKPREERRYSIQIGFPGMNNTWSTGNISIQQVSVAVRWLEVLVNCSFYSDYSNTLVFGVERNRLLPYSLNTVRLMKSRSRWHTSLQTRYWDTCDYSKVNANCIII